MLRAHLSGLSIGGNSAEAKPQMVHSALESPGDVPAGLTPLTVGWPEHTKAGTPESEPEGPRAQCPCGSGGSDNSGANVQTGSWL